MRKRRVQVMTNKQGDNSQRLFGTHHWKTMQRGKRKRKIKSIKLYSSSQFDSLSAPPNFVWCSKCSINPRISASSILLLNLKTTRLLIGSLRCILRLPLRLLLSRQGWCPQLLPGMPGIPGIHLLPLLNPWLIVEMWPA